MSPVRVHTAAIRDAARRLGFPLVGITTVDPPLPADRFERWLAAGLHGEMSYLASERSRQRRANPRLILPECRSSLVLGIPYPPNHLSPAPAQGRVASYAWGLDYHELLAPRLAALADFISNQAGSAIVHRSYTDTGPILEREWGQRAGLGWIGKNTCLIQPQWGSYFLLAEILLGLELEADAPFPFDRCGSCTRCIEACPTGCILPDRTLDARRCISYLTIEMKGPIPAELRPQMGQWVFGCDVCQQVCPWNRFASPAEETIFEPRADIALPVLVEELRLTPQSFNQKFKNSPVRRAKRRGYLRNVTVALANTKDPAAVPALCAALQHDEPLVRGHAAWGLGQFESKQARTALSAALTTETDTWVLYEIQAALEG